jgi:multiple sugar transport system ATP-binding protein
VADFMGSPPMNLVPAKVTAKGLSLDAGELDMGAGWDAGTLPADVTLGIRPEHISVVAKGGDLQLAPVMIENTGAECYVTFSIGGKSVTARVPGRMEEESTEPLRIAIARDALCLFDAQSGLRIAR